ncbi:unnamed protein product [Rotaria magnacalcarata]
MEYSRIQLDDLPDEILMIIFKKLGHILVLYSLIGINKRLNKIAHDSIFTNHLTLIASWNHSICALPYPILDQFCSRVLPEIHDKIKWLELETFSMERILFATTYPNLYGLRLHNIQQETAIRIFSDDTPLTNIFKSQISSLVIDVIENKKQSLIEDVNAFIFTHIITIFSNLQYLNFCPSLFFYQYLSFDNSPPTVFSSTLLELRVCLENFTDCLYLLDGRFNQLRTLHVKIFDITFSSLVIDNKDKLPNLKHFLLNSDMKIDGYDELLLPLLHRMLNLEKLCLCLTVCERNRFIDISDLEKDIINHMPQLNKFLFNIYSTICFNDQIDLPSNEDIQHRFKASKDNKMISCIDYFPSRKEGQCHIYSYPYRGESYKNLTNNFPGGFFQYVHELTLYDEHPFEHEFFLRISQSFPFIKR